MKIINTVSEMLDISANLPLGRCLVPTMGALHEGHIALLDIARESDLVIATLFVNPLQFNNKSDFSRYPNSIEEDLYIFKKCNVDILFMPEQEDILNALEYKKIDSGLGGTLWEGKYREGHFNGVLTIVDRLFKILKPTKAVFGMKDFQQLCLIFSFFSKKYSVEIIPVETQRNIHGLAYSSRNKLLSKTSIKKALIINKCLNEAKRVWHYDLDRNELKKKLIKILKTEPILDIEYVQINPLKDLEELISGASLNNLFKQDTSKWEVLMIAGYIDGVRLIDNIILK